MRAQTAANQPSSPADLRGGKWAVALGSALLIALALAGALHRLSASQQRGREEVIQVPVANAPSTPRPPLPAPDPDDLP